MKLFGQRFHRAAYAAVTALLAIAAVELAIVTWGGSRCDDINYGTIVAMFLTVFSLGLPVLLPGVAGAIAGYRRGACALLCAVGLLAISTTAYESVRLIPHQAARCVFDL